MDLSGAQVGWGGLYSLVVVVPRWLLVGLHDFLDIAEAEGLVFYLELDIRRGVRGLLSARYGLLYMPVSILLTDAHRGGVYIHLTRVLLIKLCRFHRRHKYQAVFGEY